MIGTLQYFVGDATYPEMAGTRVIAHICNDQGRWGSGFTAAVSRRWEVPERLYRVWYHFKIYDGVSFRLGEVQFIDVMGYNPPRIEDRGIWVANMVAQHGLRSRDNPQPVSYDHLRQCLAKLSHWATKMQAEVVMPRIGTGLGGGKWETIELMIREELVQKNVTVTVYDLKETLS